MPPDLIKTNMILTLTPMYLDRWWFVFVVYTLMCSKYKRYLKSLVECKAPPGTAYLKIMAFFCIVNVIQIFPKIKSFLPLLRPYSYKQAISTLERALCQLTVCFEFQSRSKSRKFLCFHALTYRTGYPLADIYVVTELQI